MQLMTDLKRFAKDYPALSEKVIQFAKVDADDLWILAGALNRPEIAAVAEQNLQHFCEKCGLLRLDLAQKICSQAWSLRRSPAIRKRISNSSGSPISPCSSGTTRAKRWNAAHHPFTSPHENDMAKLEANVHSVSDPRSPLGEIRALAYDVVLNGTELGSGSIRIHRQDIQAKIFQALGMSDEEAQLPLRILPRSIGIWHASTRRHRSGTRPHRHDSRRRRQSARSDSLPQDGSGR